MALDLGLDQDLDLDFKATLDLIEAVKDQKKAQKIHLLQMRIIRYKVKNIIQERRKEGGKLKRLYFKKSWRTCKACFGSELQFDDLHMF